MITKTFKFEDYDGNMRKEEHSFTLQRVNFGFGFLKIS